MLHPTGRPSIPPPQVSLPQGPAGGLSPGRWAPAMPAPPGAAPPPLAHMPGAWPCPMAGTGWSSSRARATEPRTWSPEEQRGGPADHRPRGPPADLLQPWSRSSFPRSQVGSQVLGWALAVTSSIPSSPPAPGTGLGVSAPGRGQGELLRGEHTHISTTRSSAGPESTPRKHTLSS